MQYDQHVKQIDLLYTALNDVRVYSLYKRVSDIKDDEKRYHEFIEGFVPFFRNDIRYFGMSETVYWTLEVLYQYERYQFHD